jgi:hypothetical protein
MRLDLLRRNRRSLLQFMPSPQFPTGAIMPLTRRLELLRRTEETDSSILEDDYDSDFRCSGPPPTALAGLDGRGRVFSVGTFSKSGGGPAPRPRDTAGRTVLRKEAFSAPVTVAASVGFRATRDF